jgi:hypothetical protein
VRPRSAVLLEQGVPDLAADLLRQDLQCFLDVANQMAGFGAPSVYLKTPPHAAVSKEARMGCGVGTRARKALRTAAAESLK